MNFFKNLYQDDKGNPSYKKTSAVLLTSLFTIDYAWLIFAPGSHWITTAVSHGWTAGTIMAVQGGFVAIVTGFQAIYWKAKADGAA